MTEARVAPPDLVPYPMDALVRRMFRELERRDAIFDLPRRKFFTGEPGIDLSVDFHGHRASSPLGPAAGPQTQMAQNLVLSWLGGCRVLELKTVQINDKLEIPRPCIDVHTVGLNAEWSQELKLEESLEEYVKGAMLIEMLRHGPLPGLAGFENLVYDISVGYDLAGIRSEPVRAFLNGMSDAAAVVERLRRQIPDEYREFREIDFETRLSNTVTLSTFHGCPPTEIEQISEHLLREGGFHTIVKFNPMLLGPARVRELLHERLGYHDLEVPESAFERDTSWQQAVDLTGRLGDVASELELGFGAKFSNTLIVRNARGFLAPNEAEVYLSGEPLHVLAAHLVRRFRREFGDRFPISFSAGIDRQNFPEAASLGLVPITVCTDLLRKGGYGRLTTYYGELRKRMASVGATSLDEFILKAHGQADAALGRLGRPADDPALARCRKALVDGTDMQEAAGAELYPLWVSAARLLNTERYIERLFDDGRYTRDRNAKGPAKIGSHLELFDCVTCDICVPVCPNDANFTFGSDQTEIERATAVRDEDGWSWREEEPLRLERRHQIANFADFCNECGNCDIFCPEDGGPYVVKPRFFGERTAWHGSPELDGFFLERDAQGDLVLGRFEGGEHSARFDGDRVTYSGDGFCLEIDWSDRASTLRGEGARNVDLTFLFILDYIRRAVLNSAAPNYVNARFAEESAGDLREPS